MQEVSICSKYQSSVESHYQAKLATIFFPLLEKIAFTDSSKKQRIAALRSTERCQSATELECELDRSSKKVQLEKRISRQKSTYA